jgi:hypothetical protein
LDLTALVGALVLQDTLHGHNAEFPARLRNRTAVVQSPINDHKAEIIDFTRIRELKLQDAKQEQNLDTPILSEGKYLTIQDGKHYSLIDRAPVVCRFQVDPKDCNQYQNADIIDFPLFGALIVVDSSHAHYSTDVRLKEKIQPPLRVFVAREQKHVFIGKSTFKEAA